jgi:hypothetical protein
MCCVHAKHGILAILFGTARAVLLGGTFSTCPKVPPWRQVFNLSESAPPWRQVFNLSVSAPVAASFQLV